MATKSKFLSELITELKPGRDDAWLLTNPLFYYSEILDDIVKVSEGFGTDFASVPRVPIVYWFWGGRVHREAVLHDYLFRKDSKPKVSFWLANRLFLEAMKSRNKPWYIRWPMFLGVCIGGWPSYHKKKVNYKF